MHRLDDLVTIGEASKLKGVSIDTLRRWEREGKITTHRTEGGHRRYKVADLLQINQPEKTRFTICYGRVSTREKKDDLQRQLLVLESFCQQEGWDNIHVLKDIGSGMNYRKKGLLKLVEMLQRDEIERLVITDKDRLLRFGSELIFALCELNHVQVTILNRPADVEPEKEFVDDILSILTVFSARLYGRRSRKNLKRMQVLHDATNEIIENT